MTTAEPSLSLLPGASIFLSPSAMSSSFSVGLGMPPGLLRKLARRSASERMERGEFEGSGAELDMDEEGVRPRMVRRWRHSFSTFAEAQEPFHFLSRCVILRRLRFIAIDVGL